MSKPSEVVEKVKADDENHLERGNERYLAYFARFRQINLVLLRMKRYLAYASDVGESFRPVFHPKMVTFTYGISWAYVLGESCYAGYQDFK